MIARRSLAIFTFAAAFAALGMLMPMPSSHADDPTSAPTLAPPPYTLGPDSLPQAGVPQGEMLSFPLTHSAIYPGTARTIWVYVPAQYRPEKPACLCVGLDGPGNEPTHVFDNLIAQGKAPITIGVFVSAGAVNKPGTGQPVRYNRSFEFDSTNDRFARFLIDEVLPAVETHKTADGRAIHLSKDPNDAMIYGASSGGVCAFTAAWQRPDRFRRVFTSIGTYVGMRGADSYVTLVRKTEPKPLRIFLQDGAQDTWNPLFDNWFTQNRSMEESLHWANYDVTHVWGTLGHEGTHAASLFPQAVTWLWRDYPQPIAVAASPNSMLQSVLTPGASWQPVAFGGTPTCLATAPNGIVYAYDAAASTVFRLDSTTPNAPPVAFVRSLADVIAMTVAADGRLLVATGAKGKSGNPSKIVAYDAQARPKNVAIFLDRTVRGLFAASDGAIYATTDEVSEDAPARLWRIAPNGDQTLLDAGLRGAGGVLLSPDHNLIFAPEATTHWIYSYILAPDGTLRDKQRFYYLHTAEASRESTPDADDGAGATDLIADAHGYLYVATRMGVQICDRNGRVQGILTFPAGPVTHLGWGGERFDTLYIVCGGHLYRRKVQIPGVPNWATPTPLPDFGAG